MGKTSLMHELVHRLGAGDDAKYICLFVDFQKCKDAADAIVELSLSTKPYGNLWKKAKGVFANIIQSAAELVDSINIYEVGVKLRAGLTASNWRVKGDEIFQILSTADHPVILFWDEVPILVNRILKGDDYKITPERRAEADAFLSWIRDNSLKYQKKISIVLTGSIGLEPILKQASLSATINNFSPFELKPWDHPTAEGCLMELAKHYKLTFQNGVVAKVLECLGYYIPHHVQMFFSHLKDNCRRQKHNDITIHDVQYTYTCGLYSVRYCMNQETMRRRKMLIERL